VRKALLYCAHPGHELRLYGWLRAVHPTVCFLTDGSGADGTPRLARSSELIDSAGALAGPMYGSASDRAIYAALLAGEAALFHSLARDLAAVLVEGDYDMIVGDAAEGYNPSHDVARMLVDNAVEIVRGRGARIDNYAFPLVGHPQHPSAGTTAGPLPLHLDDAALEAKIECGRAYARETGGILVSEVDEAIERFGIDAFRQERLFIAGAPSELVAAFDDIVPFYETYGAQQVASGRYTSAIRWKDHVRPVACALGQTVVGRA
jgi:hypothetical protein